LHIPSGTYAFNSGVTKLTGSGVRIIEGEGWDTVLDYQGTADIGITIDVDDVNDEALRGILFRDLRLTSTTGTPTVGIYAGANATYYQIFNMDHVMIDSFSTSGSVGFLLGKIVEGKYDNCNFSLNYDGVRTVTSDGPTTITFSNSQLRNNARFGGYFIAGDGFTFDQNTVAESNGDSGLVFKNPSNTVDISNIRLRDCWFENNNGTTDGYTVDIAGYTLATTPVVNVTIESCVFGGVATPNVAEGNWYLKYHNTHLLVASNNTFQTDADIGVNKYVVGTASLYDEFKNNSISSTKYSSAVPHETIKVGKLLIKDATTPSNFSGSISSGLYNDTVTANGDSAYVIADWASVFGGLVLVSGMDITGNHLFQDTIVIGLDTFEVLSGVTVKGTPGSRIYTNPTTTSLDLTIEAKSGTTYQVRSLPISLGE